MSARLLPPCVAGGSRRFRMVTAIKLNQVGDIEAVDAHAVVAGILDGDIGKVGVANDRSGEGNILEVTADQADIDELRTGETDEAAI